MTKGAAGGTGSGIALGAMAKGGGLAAILLLGVGLAAHFMTREVELPGPPVDPPQSPAPQAGGDTGAMPDPAQPSPAVTVPDAAAPEPATGAPQGQAALPAPPVFDLLRIEPDGSGLVAGRAHPGSSVALLVDGAEAGSAAAGPTGEFAIFFSLPPSDVPRLLTLRMRLAEGPEIASADQVVLAPGDVAAPPSDLPADLPADTPALAETTPEEQPAAGSSPMARTDADTLVPSDGTGLPDMVAEAPASPDRAAPGLPAQAGLPGLADPAVPGTVAPAAPGLPAAPDAPAVSDAPPAIPVPAAPQPVPEMAAILLGPEGVRVLQPGAASAPGQLRPVTIDAISYTAMGAVQLAGRGTPGQRVRLYLNNAALTEFPVAADGGWGGVLPEVAPGRYTLRADQIGAGDAVTARFETPFQRETLEALAAATGRPVMAEDRVAQAEPGRTTPQAAAEGEAGTGMAGVAEAAGATGASAPAQTRPEADTGALSDAGQGSAPQPDRPATTSDSAPSGGADPGPAPAPVAEAAPVAVPAAGVATEAAVIVTPAPEAAAAPGTARPPETAGASAEIPAAPSQPLPDRVSGTSPPQAAEPPVVTEPEGASATAPPTDAVTARPAPVEAVAATSAAAPAPVSVTVQPGFTLWAIARDQLGEGVLYVQVFEANRDRIRDPDLIYPGQVFAIPERETP